MVATTAEMRVVVARQPRSSIFLGLTAIWLVSISLTALSSLFSDDLPRQFAKARLALAEDATPALAGSIGMSAEMVRLIEKEAVDFGLLALYGTERLEALTLQTFRCRQFFYPREVVLWRSGEDVAQHTRTEGSIVVLDYTASRDHPFAEDFVLASEYGLLRMWRRKEGY